MTYCSIHLGCLCLVLPDSEVYSEQKVLLTCIVRDSNILAWEVPDRIGLDQLAFTSNDNPGATNERPEQLIAAELISVNKTGQTVIQSALRIAVMGSHTDTEVNCRNIVHDVQASITLQNRNKPSVQIHIVNNQICVSDSLQFICTVDCSSNLKWGISKLGNETLDCSWSDSKICHNNTIMIYGIEVTYLVCRTPDGCYGSLSIGARGLPTNKTLEVTCQNGYIGTTDRAPFVISEGTCI